ncbi:pilus assembly protein CpaB [Arthrobacter sp. CAU 1506]|uniref:Flp pilus assembly protein CpaB n=1 Tax=Arthrobacter sp. CAU 1506 TaxID=2560052 RepID=UPI0010ABCB1F|nr:RcpC/CpaB family pilus assembly protein [Arthrobacter sp. CAU 1506]TJY71518.1 pilus assembly protein CpaB [Arthrobacter sp. CAU 1506]
MKARLLGGIAALLLAVIGTVLLVTYVQNADHRAAQGLEPTNVLVVQEKVPAGTPVESLASVVELEAIPSSAVPASAVASLTDLKGKITSVELQPGEQLLATRLVEPDELIRGTVPVPDGLQEVTVQLEPQRVIGGKVKAGDTVGLFISYESEGENGPAQTKLVAHKMLVTGLQRAPESDGTTGQDDATTVPQDSLLVTLAGNDRDAAKIVHGSEFGKVWLSKEPAEAKESDPLVFTKEEVYR